MKKLILISALLLVASNGWTRNTIYETYDCIERREGVSGVNYLAFKYRYEYEGYLKSIHELDANKLNLLKNEIIKCMKNAGWDNNDERVKNDYKRQLEERIRKEKRRSEAYPIASVGSKSQDQTESMYRGLANYIDTGNTQYSKHDQYCDKLDVYGIDGCVAYDWDAFYDQYGRLMWRCREVQTGRFTQTAKCSGLSKDDDRWPNK